MSGVKLRRWKGVAASRRGRGHIADGVPCQDQSLYIERRGIVLAAVADGAGSARLSERGAKSVLKVASSYFCSRARSWADSKSVVVGLLSACQRELGVVASELGCSVEDLATTLVFVAASPMQVLAGRVGDGVIVGRRGNEMVILAAAGEHEGEFHNETVFVTSPGVEALVWSAVFPRKEFDGFALMSDGAAESLHRRSDGAVAPAVKNALAWLERHSADDVRVAVEENLMPVLLLRTHDDCSLALMGNVPIEESELECLPNEIQKQILGVGNDLGLRNRLAVLKSKDLAINEAAEATGLHASTVQQHRRTLSDIME